jgi:hypothetical protein
VSFNVGGITTGMVLGARQAVQTGATNSSGYANMLSAGTGLAINLAATTVPVRTAFALGVKDYIATLTSDVASVVTLPASNTSFISQDYVNPSAVTWSSTLAQPQYGYSYIQNQQSVLQFGGSAGSTTFLDDFGNTWTAHGSAKVQTTSFKFGTGALGGAGTSNVLNGSSDYISSSSFTSLGQGGWSLRCWFNPVAVSSATFQTILMAGQSASGYGAAVGIASSKMSYYLSSTATSWDIASAGTGTATLTAGTWNFIEITYDPVAGKYFGYLNGVLDYTVTSSSKICPVPVWSIGSATTVGNFFSGYIDKFEYLPYCQHPAGTTYTVPTAAPNVATQGYAADFFSIPQMTMYQVSGASTGAGTTPTFTAKNRVYIGEAVTSSSAISSVVNYALNGRYDSGLFAVAASTVYAKSHNLGTTMWNMDSTLADDINGTNERIATQSAFANYGYYGGVSTRNSSSVGFATNVGYSTANAAITSGFFRIKTRRSF